MKIDVGNLIERVITEPIVYFFYEGSYLNVARMIYEDQNRT